MKKTFLILASLFIALIQLNAQNANVFNKKIPLDSTIIHGKLDNGLTYYVKHNATPKNRAQLLLVVNAGSVMEDSDQLGLAHMCEHMAFNGTKNFPKHALIEYLESIGMKFGADLNAQTSFDETLYMIEVPLDKAEFLQKGLQVIADWSHDVSYETEEINAERNVIKEEWRLGKGAQERIRNKTLPVLLQGSKYAERLPIGDTTVFLHCPPDNLRRFYKDWYRNDLEAVIVVGDFDAQKVAEQVKTLFSKFPKKENPRKAIHPEIPDHSEMLVKVATDKEQPYNLIQMVYKHDMKPNQTYADYREYLKSELLSGIINQRLSDLTKKPKSAVAYAGASYSHLIGLKDNFAAVALAKNGKIKEAITTLFSELQIAKQNGINQSELDLQKKSLLKQYEKMYNERDKQKSKNLAFELKSNFDITKTAVPGIETEFKLANAFVPTIQLKELNALLKQWISDNNLVITVAANDKNKESLPTEDEIKNIVKEISAKKFEAKEEVKLDKDLLAKLPKKAGKIKSTSEDKVLGTTTFMLSNGAKVIVKTTDFKDDEINLSAFSWGGASLYPLNKNIEVGEAADIVASSGLGQYNNIEFDKYLKTKTASVRPFISTYSEGFRGSSSKADFEAMLQMVYAYFTEPRLDKDAFDAYMNQTKAFLENRSNNPQSVWQDSLMSVLSGNSPYEESLTAEDLAHIKFENILPIFKERFHSPKDFTFVFVGNIDANKAKDLIAKYIGGIKLRAKKEQYKDLGIRIPQKQIRTDVYSGTAPKSLVYTVYPSTFENTLSERLNLQAVADVFTDRLLDKIREKEALTYSISASPRTKFIPVKQSYIGVFYSCAPDNINKINDDIIKIVKDLQENGITDEDLQKSIQKSKRSHEMSLRKNKYWISKIMEKEQNGMMPNFVNDYDKTVNGLTKESIQKAANKFLSTDKYLLIDLQPKAKK